MPGGSGRGELNMTSASSNATNIPSSSLPNGSATSFVGRSYSDRSTLIAGGVASDDDDEAAFPESLCIRRASSVPVADNYLKSVLHSSRPVFKIQMPTFDFVGAALLGRLAPNPQAPFLENEATPTTNAQIITPNDTTSNHILSNHVPPQPLTPPDETLITFCTMENQQAISNDLAEAIGDLKISSSGEGQAAERTTGAGGYQSGELGGDNGAGEESTWVEETVKIALSEATSTTGPGAAIRVVSLSLPSPVAEAAGVSLTTAYPSLISGLQTKLQTFQSQYIQVIHAVPTGFSLNSLPTSPPGTPMGGSGEQDYFNLGNNVFTSAFALVDRHNKHTPRPSMPIPLSPCLAAPPSSIDFSLMERYIPPSTVDEFTDLFNPHGASNLVDRLLELSPHNGTLLFIYPTRAGGEIFTSKYLGPILDPLLRNIMASRRLSADIGINVGRMVAASHLLPFANMSRKLTLLLHELSHANQSTQSTYKMVYSTKETVRIERSVWMEWFVRQEKARIRQVTTEYFNRAKMLPGDDHVNYAVLTREILEGMAKREYENGDPKEGVEVGVFVLRRASR